MKIVPLNEQVVIRPTEAAAQTAGGILLPDAAKEKPQEGRVLAVGDGRRVDGAARRAPLQVSEGDRVLFSRWAGTTVNVCGEDLLIMSEQEVLAIVG